MNDRQRIARQMTDPALIRLHRALSRLGSVVTVMNTGAHPDDEQNGLLAWLRLGLGMRVIVACSTRGEGGQNVLGPERGQALGLLRTREMEEAARVLDADVIWLGFGPDDAVHDFGFSKTGEGTFDRWGEERIVKRLVRVYRAARPDIVIPTFLDVPGQHGHHRAMTRAAEAALHLAADASACPELGAPWRVAKYYLPAWGGGGGTYDDEVPPPPATLAINAAGTDPATGAAWDHIGEWSRYYHASQGMGQWRDTPRDAWNLHLKGGAEEAAITDGLPVTLGDLAALPGAPRALAGAADAVAEAIAAFPDRDRIVAALLRADAALEDEGESDFRATHGHRIARKQQEVQAAIFEAAGVVIRARAEPACLAPGQTGRIVMATEGAAGVAFAPRLPEGVTATPAQAGFDIAVAGDAPYPPQFTEGWSALGGNGAGLTATLILEGRQIARQVDLEAPLRIVPQHPLTLEPEAFILPLQALPATLRFRAEGAAPDFDAPEGIAVVGDTIHIPPGLPAGVHRLRPEVAGRAAMRVTASDHPHIGSVLSLSPEYLHLLALELTLPDARIGYIGGGGDRVGAWLGRMGCDVTMLDHLAPGQDLSRFTTLVVGIVAYGTRPDLVAAIPALHRFVEAGGHLVTLYQRPDQGWGEGVPPRPLKVGTPSLRWRVTDPAAAVTMLQPDHPLLAGPNRIGPQDWAGWDKERGLYFAAQWDDAYEPLLSLSDAGEAPLTGALLSGAIGKGRHSHVSLVLHHQLDRLVPGAFRLLANLVQPAW